MNIGTRARLQHLLPLIIALGISLSGQSAMSAPLSLSDTPLFLTTGAAPLNLLVMGRDHKLYYEAYNDHSDLDEDGTLDITYKPDSIDYFGYFDSYKCYSYSSNMFVPATTTTNKQCNGSTWSGDWLNYVTTSRMDALRKVLYGGLRSTDSTSSTVLERAFIPQDAHSWGKSYEGRATAALTVAYNGYDLTKYAALALPSDNKSHLFASTTLLSTTAPLLRYVLNKQYGNGTTIPYSPLKVWHWLSIERPVADANAVTGITSGGAEVRTSLGTITDMNVRVQVCKSSVGLESNCKPYADSSGTTTYKPTGLLQQYGENGTMKFGLLTGSYLHNTDGGVLRKAVSSITNEINATNGTFIAGAGGIIQTLNNLRITGFGSSYQYSCGWIATRPINDGECQMWGNPIAEMMYEGQRYFAGKSAPNSAFSITVGAGEESGLNLPVATWNSSTNPYAFANGNGVCSKPVETVISDINNSYDTDKLPGVNSTFASGTFTNDLSGLDVSALGQSIWNNEFGAGNKNIFIGQVGAATTGPGASAPTVKTASSFGNIRGLAPEEPTKQGGYYAASVALYGHNTDLNLAASGSQKMSTFAVALASPLPRIDIAVNGRKITIIPFAKSIAGSSIDRTSSFQPTDQIVDFYVDTLTASYGKFRINFEDVEQGADHDMDAIAVYEYTVKADNTVDVKVTSEYAAGGITQHMGYVISGTTHDGIYLEVADQRGGDSATDVDYALDTPPGQLPGGTWNDSRALPYGLSSPNQMLPLQPMVTTRNFAPGSSAGAELLKAPLWYAAKYGGFDDANGSGMPDVRTEWDTDNDGDPDNYFLVTNALTLGARLSAAFNEILARVGSASSATVNSGSISNNSRVYQAKFNSGDWTGHLLSYAVNNNGTLSSTAEWDAADHIPAFGIRSIFTVGSESSFTPKAFDWTNISTDSNRKSLLASTDTEAQKILNYVRGDSSNEASNSGGTYRIRPTLLGDIVNSAPLYVGPPSFRRGDSMEGAANPYSRFVYNHRNRTNVVYAGANDGMVHAFNADNFGRELFAFIPSPVFANLKKLAVTPYTHNYYVDGSPSNSDVFYSGNWHSVLVGGLNKGGQGIYALDITTPSTFSSNGVLWEFTDANDNDLGYTYSQPAIARLKNGKWAAIFGNGYNNTAIDSHTSITGHAALYIVDVSNGSLIKKIDTQAGTAGAPNGLATPAVIDSDGDGISDYVFAGDLQGNMWKFDLSGTSASSWSIPYSSAGKPAPLYTAKDSSGNLQPITSRPEISRGPGGVGFAVFFGTGKWLEFVDKSSTAQQTFYGIYDANSGGDNFTGRNNLAPQTIDAGTIILQDGSTVEGRITSNNSPGPRGWFMDLPQNGANPSERMVAKPILRNGRIIFTTLVPSADPCSYGGDSWIMELNALTGSRLTTVSPFDVNGDGVIDSNDGGRGSSNGDPSSADIYTSGTRLEVGIAQEPGILSGQFEYKYSAGSSGEIETTTESGPKMGRQSWRQVR
jgi:type IV pilus assembly protein PilY1